MNIMHRNARKPAPTHLFARPILDSPPVDPQQKVQVIIHHRKPGAVNYENPGVTKSSIAPQAAPLT
jgi:hypothetical protein